jgi:hypothetical protein
VIFQNVGSDLARSGPYRQLFLSDSENAARTDSCLPKGLNQPLGSASKLCHCMRHRRKPWT